MFPGLQKLREKRSKLGFGCKSEEPHQLWSFFEIRNFGEPCNKLNKPNNFEGIKDMHDETESEVEVRTSRIRVRQ